MEAPLNLKLPRTNRDPIELSNDLPIDLTTPHLLIKRRSSFFNIEKKVREKLEQDEENQKRKEYMEQLEKESENWREILNDTIQKTRKLKGTKVMFDSSVLPQERKDYLAGIVDFTEYVKNTETLSDCVYFYLKEVEWRHMQIESNEKMLEEKIINVAFDAIFNNI